MGRAKMFQGGLVHSPVCYHFGMAELPEIKKRVENYFENCDATGRPYTIAGICELLNIGREQFDNPSYIRRAPYKKAKRKILRFAEEQLFKPGANMNGILFFIKNNFGDNTKDGGKKKEPKKIIIDD